MANSLTPLTFIDLLEARLTLLPWNVMSADAKQYPDWKDAAACTACRKWLEQRGVHRLPLSMQRDARNKLVITRSQSAGVRATYFRRYRDGEWVPKDHFDAPSIEAAALHASENGYEFLCSEPNSMHL